MKDIITEKIEDIILELSEKAAIAWSMDNFDAMHKYEDTIRHLEEFLKCEE